ncbi:twin-arginine translocase subunit TatC [Schinkia sp. CFF1]
MDQDQGMNLVGHLEELRKRIIITGVAFVIFFIVAFIYVTDIYHFFVRGLDFKLTILSPTEVVWVYIQLACVVSIALTIPVLAWQVWLFIKPGLKPLERKVTLSYIPALFILFIMGLSFAYFYIFPLVFDFLISLSGDNMQTMFTIEKYFGFLLKITLPFGFLFELPVVIMFLTSLGIVNPQRLTKIRKYAYLVLAVIAAAITPPDWLSQIVVMVPLCILYEASIQLSKIVYRKRLKKEKMREKEYGMLDSDEQDVEDVIEN